MKETKDDETEAIEASGATDCCTAPPLRTWMNDNWVNPNPEEEAQFRAIQRAITSQFQQAGLPMYRHPAATGQIELMESRPEEDYPLRG